jgi:iron complex transport system substrate-binding protein
MAGGNWMPELIDLAGGSNVLSSWITWDQLAASDPDIIVVAPCGFDVAASQRDWHYLASNPAWNNLRAVRNGNVHIEDGNQFFNRPGPRLAESFEILAEIFDRWRR